MNYVEPMFGKHAIEICVPMRHGIANVQAARPRSAQGRKPPAHAHSRAFEFPRCDRRRFSRSRQCQYSASVSSDTNADCINLAGVRRDYGIAALPDGLNG